MDMEAVCVAEQLRTFLKKGERVLICPDATIAPYVEVFKEAITACDAIAVVWQDDRRWKTLLRLAFTHKVGTIIAPPVLLLGLAKLARVKNTPLYIHNVVTTSYPCREWMAEGIINGLDCTFRNLDTPWIEGDWSQNHPPKELLAVSREIMEWTSVLDCHLERSTAGLEIEIVVFPGEMLPKLPSCAKLCVRAWDPDRDQPMTV